MKKITFVTSLGILILLSFCLFRAISQVKQNVGTGTTTDCAKQTGLSKVICLAEAFKATLKEDQIAQLQLAYSKKDAARWSNFPQAFSNPKRVGISLGSLSATQLAAAKVLITTVLAQGQVNEGYDEWEGILTADDYFGKTTGQTGTFGRSNYYIAFLGQPGTTSLWELQFGGHHFAFANTYNGGKLIGTTPSFRGVEPMQPVTANGRTYQPMEQERAAFAQIISELSSTEKTTAKLSATFNDILLGPGRDGQFPATKLGIKVSDLSSKQQQQIVKAMELYVADLDAETGRQVMAKYKEELAGTYIAYSGSGTMNTTNDYVRIDGPGVWIEYSAQPSRDFPGTTHPHSVWRDHNSDYGGK